MTLPAPVELYFAAAQDPGGDVPLSAFVPGAVVVDEGRTHVGHDAIAAWWRASREAYGHRAAPRDMRERDGLTVVRAQVTGDFPGSPALLTFAFGLQGERISTLEIGA